MHIEEKVGFLFCFVFFFKTEITSLDITNNRI